MKMRLLLAFFIFVVSTCLAETKIIAHIVVDPGEFERENCPVSVSINGLNINIYEGIILQEIIDSQFIQQACQIEPGNSPKLCWILKGITKPGNKRYFRLLAGKTSTENESTGVKVLLDNNSVKIIQNRKYVLQYNYTPVSPPDGIDSIYTRSAFIHPLWTPSGEVLTRIQPPDHYHHMGIWNPWTKTKFEGREVDFWNLGKGQGTVRFKTFTSLINGPVFGGFKAVQEHVDLNAPGGEKTAINEVCEARVWNISGEEAENWLWDFTSTLNCATDSQLLIEKYRYAGLGFRATELWTNKNSEIITSEGKTRKDADATKARWCNVYGKMIDGKAGILFMSHPYNRQHPEPMRIWPENSNGGRGDVFFEFCPIRNNDWLIQPGKDYVLHYRMYVYNGEISTKFAEQLWTDFAFPPGVKIELLNNK
ncbi:PmoA family protein [Bacteroidota bacterium]